MGACDQVSTYEIRCVHPSCSRVTEYTGRFGDFEAALKSGSIICCGMPMKQVFLTPPQVVMDFIETIQDKHLGGTYSSKREWREIMRQKNRHPLEKGEFNDAVDGCAPIPVDGLPV